MATAARRVCCSVVVVLVAQALLPVRAQALPPVQVQTEASAPQPPRLKIGLALGGGGARGCAHIGVLRVLERMHIPVDYVAGTSMGAVVGGLYASGMNADEIERALTTVDWHDALNDRTRFKDLSFRRKEDESRYLTAFEAGLRGRSLRLPRGLRSAQKVRFIVQSHLVPVAEIRDFSRLPVPFKAVAADIETGEKVVLDHGDLEEAIRASMSIPGIFSPVELDGRLLVDGGVADNVPVDVVRAMGADIVIAVDVGSPLLKRDRLGSLFSITNQVLTLLTRRTAEPQLAAANVVITPPVANFATMDFADAKPIIAAGEQEAERQRAQLLALALTPEAWAELIAQRPKREESQHDLDFIQIEGSRRVDHRIIRAHMLTQASRPLDPDLLRHDVTRIYGLDDFEQVTFSMRELSGLHGLVLSLKDKPWGPTYLRFGLHTEDDLQGDSTFTVAVNATRTRMNALGGEWRNDFRLGREHGFMTEFYQPLDFGGRFFVAPGAQLMRTRSSLWEDRRRIAEYGVATVGASLDLGIALGEWGELRAGVARARIHTTVDTGSADLPAGRIDFGAFRTKLTILRLDDPGIPRDGGNFEVEAYTSRRALGSESDYSKAEAQGMRVMTVGRETFLIGAGVGTNFHTDMPLYDEFSLGGFLSLGGFALGQLHGQRAAIIRSGTYFRLRELPPDLGEAIYGGVMYEIGNAWPAGVPATIHDIHRSITLVVGAKTIVGPIIIGYGRAETGDDRFYVTIGKTF